MKAQFTKTNDPITRMANAINQMLGQDMSSFFERRIYPMYQKAQKSRWQTENTSEGPQWRELNPAYVAYKKKKYAAYPGKGTKKIIATSKLVTAAVGDGSGLNKVITPTGIRIAIDLGRIPYAKNVANEFPIMKFSDQTINKMKDALRTYIKQGMKR